MELYGMLFIFIVCMVISSILNVLFKTTDKKHWLISFGLSITLSFFIYAALSG